MNKSGDLAKKEEESRNCKEPHKFICMYTNEHMCLQKPGLFDGSCKDKDECILLSLNRCCFIQYYLGNLFLSLLKLKVCLISHHLRISIFLECNLL